MYLIMNNLIGYYIIDIVIWNIINMFNLVRKRLLLERWVAIHIEDHSTYLFRSEILVLIIPDNRTESVGYLRVYVLLISKCLYIGIRLMVLRNVI